METQIFRALVVDDDPAVRESTARAMTGQSFWCETAADGVEALEKYRASRHDLVVTDLRMPRMHGYALALELLKDAQPPRIVVLTGIVEPSLVKDLFGRGVDDVLNKPIDVHVFATKMASLFQRQHWRESILTAQRESPALSSGHTLIADIEHTLEGLETAVPDHCVPLFEFAAATASDPPQAMISFLERNLDGLDGDGERRQSARASLLATVTAIPLSRTLQPCGEPFKGAARDASAGGLSLLHTRAVTAEHLALRWPSLASPGKLISLILQVHRCQPMGPFYEVAGKFVPQAHADDGQAATPPANPRLAEGPSGATRPT